MEGGGQKEGSISHPPELRKELPKREDDRAMVERREHASCIERRGWEDRE